MNCIYACWPVVIGESEMTTLCFTHAAILSCRSLLVFKRNARIDRRTQNTSSFHCLDCDDGFLEKQQADFFWSHRTKEGGRGGKEARKEGRKAAKKGRGRGGGRKTEKQGTKR